MLAPEHVEAVPDDGDPVRGAGLGRGGDLALCPLHGVTVTDVTDKDTNVLQLETASSHLMNEYFGHYTAVHTVFTRTVVCGVLGYQVQMLRILLRNTF